MEKEEMIGRGTAVRAIAAVLGQVRDEELAIVIRCMIAVMTAKEEVVEDE